MAGEAKKEIDKEVLWGGGRSPFSLSYGKQMMWIFLVSDALTFGGLLTALGFAKLKYVDVWPNSEEVFYHFPFAGHIHLPLLYVALMTFILIVSSVTMVMAVEAGHRKAKKSIVKWLFATVIGGAIFLGSQAWEWNTFINGNKEHSTAFDLVDLYRANIVMKEHGGHIPEFNPNGENALDVAIDALKNGEANLQIRGGELLKGEDAVKRIQGARQIQGANMQENEYGHQLYADAFFGITGFHGFHVFSGVIINLIILINVSRGVYDKRGHFEMVEKAGLYWHFVDLVWVFVFTFFYLL